MLGLQSSLCLPSADSLISLCLTFINHKRKDLHHRLRSYKRKLFTVNMPLVLCIYPQEILKDAHTQNS